MPVIPRPSARSAAPVARGAAPAARAAAPAAPAPRAAAPAPRPAAPRPAAPAAGRPAAPAARPAVPVSRPAAPAAAARPAATAPAKAHPQVHPTSNNAQKLQTALNLLLEVQANLTGGGVATPAPKAAAAPATPSAAPRAAAGSSPRPVAKPAAAPAAAPAPEVDPGADLSSLNRAQLVALAGQYGVETTGLKAEDLRKAITEAMGGGAPAEEAPAEEAPAEEAPAPDMDPVSIARAETLMGILTEHSDRYEALVDPNSQEPDSLRCGGDCMRCPNPEGYENAELQIAACHQAVHADLGVEEPQYQ